VKNLVREYWLQIVAGVTFAAIVFYALSHTQ
jgi:hypothetical protein